MKRIFIDTNILLDLGFSKVEYKKLSLGIVTIYKAKK